MGGGGGPTQPGSARTRSAAGVPLGHVRGPPRRLRRTCRSTRTFTPDTFSLTTASVSSTSMRPDMVTAPSIWLTSARIWSGRGTRAESVAKIFLQEYSSWTGWADDGSYRPVRRLHLAEDSQTARASQRSLPSPDRGPRAGTSATRSRGGWHVWPGDLSGSQLASALPDVHRQRGARTGAARSRSCPFQPGAIG